MAAFGRRREATERRGTPADLLVVGLGNPGAEYARSRHNVGFEVVDLLAERHGGAPKRTKFRALADEVRMGDQRVALAAPQTYMNDSGEAVAPLVPGQAAPDPEVVRRATGLRVEGRPPDGRMGAIVGWLTTAAADALGLRPGIPVAGGTNDAFASYLGAGLLEPGDAYDPGGSAGGFGVYWHEPVEVPGAFVTPSPLAGRWSVGAAMAATGRALDWFRQDILDGATTTERLIEEAATTPPGADGLVFLPYLAGERSPIWDPTATGLLAGVTLAHGRAHVTRAILEASALAIRHVAMPTLAAGVSVTAMRACGGPARSEVWNQIKADVTGFRVLVPAVLETAVLGSAMLGAAAIGAHASVDEAVRSMTHIDRELSPRPEVAEAYDRAFEVYTALYPAVAPILRGHTVAAGAAR